MGLPGSPRFNVRTDVSNGVARLAVVGELDMSSAPILQDQLHRVVQDGAEAALLDFRDVTFMGAAGVHVLLAGKDYARQNGHRMAIVGVGGEVRRVLEITETDALLLDENAGMELIGRFMTSEPAASAESSAGSGVRDGA